MADPTEYQRDYDFTLTEKGPALNTELDNLAQTTDETIAALADVRRSDGKLQNGIVTSEALAPGAFDGSVEAAIAAAEAAQAVAETAQAGAETAQEAAETAQKGAETAKGEAETAQGAAETAQAGAEAAKADAEATAAGITSQSVAKSLATTALQFLKSTAAGTWEAVTGTDFGFGFLSLADAAAARTKLDLKTAANYDVSTDTDMAVATGSIPTRAAVSGFVAGSNFGGGGVAVPNPTYFFANTVFQNTSNRAVVYMFLPTAGQSPSFYLSNDGVTYLGPLTAQPEQWFPLIVPAGAYWKLTGTTSITCTLQIS